MFPDRPTTDRGAALAIVLVTLAAVLVLVAAIGGIVLAHIRTVEAAVRADADLVAAEGAIDVAAARLVLDPAWRPAAPQTIAWAGGGATVEIAVETAPARLRLVGRALEAAVEVPILLDAPVLMALVADTEIRLDTGVTVAGPAAGDPVWASPAGDPPASLESVLGRDDAPGTRPLPVAEMAAAAARTIVDPPADSLTVRDEIVVVHHEDADDTTPFAVGDLILDEASVLVLGDLIVTGAFDGTPMAGHPLLVVTGSLAVEAETAPRRTSGVVAVGGAARLRGPLEHRGLVQAATVDVAGEEDSPVEIDDDPAGRAAGFWPVVRRLGWRKR